MNRRQSVQCWTHLRQGVGTSSIGSEAYCVCDRADSLCSVSANGNLVDTKEISDSVLDTTECIVREIDLNKPQQQ